MKMISKLVVALSLLAFAPVAASAASDWQDTSKSGQQRWGY
jgi:hypothetical protein